MASISNTTSRKQVKRRAKDKTVKAPAKTKKVKTIQLAAAGATRKRSDRKAPRTEKAGAIKLNVTGLASKPRFRKGAVIRTDGLEEGGVDALLVDAVKARGGALHSALCKKVKWKKCDRRLARAALIAGVKLKATRVDGGDIRFEVA